GFLYPEEKLAVLSDAEIFGRAASQRARRAVLRRERAKARTAAVNFSDFEEGDLVIHLEHGVGRFAGLQKFPLENGIESDVLTLEFAETAKLYVPIDQAWKISRYVGLGKKAPPLSELGDAKWERQKRSAEKAIAQYAASLLKLHAERETSQGHAFRLDTEWQKEFENAFLFDETRDQLRSTDDIKKDMESARPMDRLLCGDVGFGKTEVAIRAAFKAVMDGKQVAILTPTTVLAQQHFETFRERMSDYPVSIELLSRYRTKGEQTQTVARLVAGQTDIVIGTHRLISKDVQFKKLGLVVVDEEQRFGVQHKERLKERFRLVDVLTLSATPIPRTLYMALMGTRDMSVIETPPPNRLPVETIVCAYDERVIRDAINRELNRGGQIYFLHNRVQSISKVADRIRQLCPKARVDIGHGQMEEGELEDVMKRFLHRDTDVLVATTIIESGLDIPNANTIIIDRADRFGLADLYQLRGRVGRSQHKAYAYLLLPRDLIMLSEARKRVSAIKQYSELGAGFKIAMRDLEIRGAGNLLGNAQSGHIITVGFDLYCRMLKKAVAQIKGEPVRTRQEVILRLDGIETDEAIYRSEEPDRRAPVFLPSFYILQPRMRIEAYRKLAECESEEEMERLCQEWKDRFGGIPEEVKNLVEVARIRFLCSVKRITILETRDDRLMITKMGDFLLIGGRFPRLTSQEPKSRLREVVAYLRAL
ncbi:MAG: transcription-repair coupling factor, partial [Chthoniobacterales bacterium]